MDTKLIGKTIYIGRNPNDSRLKIMMSVGGLAKEALMGGAGSVPETVSRCLGVAQAHCSIEILDAKTVRLKNMNPENHTRLNDHYIEQMTFEPVESTRIHLGAAGYPLNVQTILTAASSLMPQVYNVRPLNQVWEKYERMSKDIRVKKERFNAISSVTGLLSMLGVGCAFIPGMESLRVFFIVLSIVLSIVFFVHRFRSPDKNIREEQQLNDYLMDNYVCPNNNCRHFLGKQPYRIIRQNKTCPYCKAQWTEE